MQRIGSLVDIVEDNRVGGMPAQTLFLGRDVLFQQFRDLVAARLPDRLGSQPRGADGVRFGERTRTPVAEALAGEAERQRQHERQQAEQASDQNPDTLIGGGAALAARRRPIQEPTPWAASNAANSRALKAKMLQIAIWTSTAMDRYPREARRQFWINVLLNSSGIEPGAGLSLNMTGPRCRVPAESVSPIAAARERAGQGWRKIASVDGYAPMLPSMPGALQESSFSSRAAMASGLLSGVKVAV